MRCATGSPASRRRPSPCPRALCTCAQPAALVSCAPERLLKLAPSEAGISCEQGPAALAGARVHAAVRPSRGRAAIVSAKRPVDGPSTGRKGVLEMLFASCASTPRARNAAAAVCSAKSRSQPGSSMQCDAPRTAPVTMFSASAIGMRVNRPCRMPSSRSRFTKSSSMFGPRASGQPSRTRKVAASGWSIASLDTRRMPQRHALSRIVVSSARPARPCGSARSRSRWPARARARRAMVKYL